MATLLKTIGTAFASRELCNSDDCIAPGAGADESYTAPLFDIAIGEQHVMLDFFLVIVINEARVLVDFLTLKMPMITLLFYR